MEDMMKRRQIPSFGNWDFCNEVPITQFFESTRQCGFNHGYLEKEADLFKVPPSPLPYHYQKPRKQKQGSLKEQKQGRVCDDMTQQKQRRHRAPKAVDEDLYKIPQEFLYQKPKRRVVVSDFWKRCLGLNCIS